jgi:hypothetical protein
MCSLTICLSLPTNEKRDRKPELAAKELPPHISYAFSLVLIPNGNGKPEATPSSPHPELLVPSRVHCSINGKRRVVMKREREMSCHRPPELLVEAPAVFVNKPETAIHNGKRQRDPELLVWRRMLVVNEDSSYFIPTGNGNGVRCAVYLYEFW